MNYFDDENRIIKDFQDSVQESLFISLYLE